MAFKKSIILWAKDTQVIERGGSVPYGLNGQVGPTLYLPESSPTEETKTVFDSISLDCVMAESHHFENEVTSYPVSSGFIISEHVIKKNFRFGLIGLVTNVNMPTELSLISTVGKVAGSMVNRVVGPILGSLLGSAAHALDSSAITVDPISETYLKLQKLVREGTVVHVATILGTYEGCVLRAVDINQDVRTSTVMPVRLTFEQLKIIQPDGRVGFNASADLKKALNTNTPTDTELMLKALKNSGVNILGSIL